MEIHHVPLIQAQINQSEASTTVVENDPTLIAAHLADAGAFRAESMQGVLRPKNEAALSAWMATNQTQNLVIQGAMSSLTGGCIPDSPRDIVVSTEYLTNCRIEGLSARLGAGMILADLDTDCAEKGLFFPPVPTFLGASVGGVTATNAAGAATFKYGTTRDWVDGIRLVLRNGEILALKRGQVVVKPGDVVELQGHRSISLPIPRYVTPPLKKISAGYFVKENVDLIDLFIGSEGTLGILTEINIRLLPRPAVVTGLVFFNDESRALEFTACLTRKAQTQWSSGEGIDCRSIEMMDKRSLELAIDSGYPEKAGIEVPACCQMALLFVVEIPVEMSDEQCQDDFFQGMEGASNSPLAALCLLLSEFDVFDDCDIAFPDDQQRRSEIEGFREAVPMQVNELIQQRQRLNPVIHKCAGDYIVPISQIAAMQKHYRRVFSDYGLDYAIWGHISDGNLHPNVLPTNAADVDAAMTALRDLAVVVKSLGGCPLSEHGVGRHPLKKELLADFHGVGAIEQMRSFKRALDPLFQMSPGVFFDAN